MTLTQRNLLANFVGSGWSALLGFAVLPMCLRMMGVEAYGLVGLFATLLSILAPLEAGLGTALNRELSTSSELLPGVSKADVVRTLEGAYWGAAVLSGILVCAVAPIIANRWVKPHALTPHTVETAILIMGLVVVFQWPQGLYSGGLAGLQRQVTLNLINGGMGTVRSVGSVLVLYFVSPTIVAYFLWQIAASGIHTAVTAVCLWRHVEHSQTPPRFRFGILRNMHGFMAGMSGTSVALLCLTQLDKVILSHILPLAMFGYYALAGGVASNLLRLVAPVQQAVFPRLSALAVRRDAAELARVYHGMAQLLAVLTIPVGVMIIVFAPEVLFVWTGDAVTAQRTATILSLLMAGTLLNALLYPPYTLQIAHGWTRLIFTTTASAAVVLVPVLILLATHFGAVGAATVWLLLNLVFLVVLVPLMHRRLLPREMKRWFWSDVLVPVGAASAVAIAGRLVFPPGLARSSLFVALAIIGVVVFTMTAIATADIRALIRVHILRVLNTLRPPKDSLLGR